MKKFVTVILFFFSLFSLFSQETNEKDSLLSLIKVEKNDSLKAEYYYLLGSSYNIKNSLKAKTNAHEIAKGLFGKTLFSPHKVFNLTNLGLCYFELKDYSLSEKYFLAAIDLASKHKSLTSEFYATEHYLVTFSDFKPNADALKYCFRIKNKVEKSNDKELLFKSLSLVNRFYHIAGIKPTIRRSISDTMLIIAKELNDTSLLRMAYFNLATSTYKLESINFYKECLLYVDSNNYSFLSSIYNNISGRYRSVNELDNAILYADSAMMYSNLAKRDEGVAAALYRKGEAYYFKNDYDKSLKYGLEALEKFKKANILRRQDMCAHLISVSYQGLGKYKEALLYFTLKTELLDSLEQVNKLEETAFVEQKINYEIAQKKDSTEIAIKQLEIKNINDRLEKQKLRQYLLYGGISMFIILALILFVGFQRKKKDNLMIEKQKKIVEEKNKEITDSIQYAKRIQSAILPPNKVVKEYLRDSFIVYLPKDIVAGDFYWLEHSNNKVLFAAADCTGHGVPGAMVSVVCNNGLNRSVREHRLTEPGAILDKTREIVVAEFEKSEEDVKDGMDMALCCLEENTLKYAGAHNPLWIIRDGAKEIEEIKADKQPIGKTDNPEPYNTHTIELNQGDTIYIFSDGYADQFGGEKGKKMKTVNFKKLLLSIRNENMKKQQELIQEAFDNWKGNLEQLDDVCIIGVRV